VLRVVTDQVRATTKGAGSTMVSMELASMSFGCNAQGRLALALLTLLVVVLF
jgi:hypothetical protein